MLTQCPNCRTIYQLGASDLSAARGYVECGECDTQFNALERLADEPAFPPAAQSPANASAGEDDGPAFVLLDATDPETDTTDLADASLEDDAPDQADEPAMVEIARADNEPVAADDLPRFEPDIEPGAVDNDSTSVDSVPVSDEPGTIESTLPDSGPLYPSPSAAREFEPIDLSSAAAPTGKEREDPTTAQPDTGDATIAGMAPLRPATTELDESDHAILFTEPDAGAVDAQADDATEPFDMDDVPAVIKDEVAALTEPRRRRFRWFWVLLAIGLTLFLAVQFALTLRTEITARAPELAALFTAACDTLGCAAAAPEPAAIELLSRDVRDHPQYRDTLLVNATLVSRADAPVPFPVLQLGLQGPTGDVLGIRRFEPREYLDKSIDIAGGMPPDRAVYIVLEVAQVGARAVSFEFDFL